MALVNYHNEYSTLKRVVLYRPSVTEISTSDPSAFMYEELPNPEKVRAEFDRVVSRLEQLGVEVIVLSDVSGNCPRTPNMIFLRDVAMVFKDTVVLANMRYPIRKAEPKKFANLLVEYNALYKQYIADPLEAETLEGADVFVLDDSTLGIYTGYRTTQSAADVIANLFPRVSIQQVEAGITRLPQHLLGGVHVVDKDLALRRQEYCKDTLGDLAFVDFVEDDEITKGFALNIVTLGPREILMPANRPQTQAKLESIGVRCHTVEIDEIHKMGGGLACMVLPLERKL